MFPKSDARSSIGASLCRCVWKSLCIVAGMGGVRLDRGLFRFALMAALVVASSSIALHAVNNGWVARYVIGCWIFYYLGNGLLLGSPLHARVIASLGLERAEAVYETVVGLMFINQGLALGAVMDAHPGTLETPPSLELAIVIPVFAIGFLSKVWATWMTGLDVYYYRDMFTGKPTAKFVRNGIYRFFKNPMYSIGNIHSYAAALWAESLEGLIAAAMFHASIFAFYYVLERPFVITTYFQQSPPLGTTSRNPEPPALL